MQTTLLGLAIAVILALVTALVGPLMVDWDHYRPQFEAEASRLIGRPLRIHGTIEARLLPTPSLVVSDVVVGPQWREPELSVRRMAVEFGLGALMRGEWRAAELHIDGPELNLGLDRTGKLDAGLTAIGFDPDLLSIDRVVVDNGSAVLTDAVSGGRLALDQFQFDGDVRSLAGPFKGDGTFVASGQAFHYRVNGSRRDDDGGMKLRLAVDPSEHPLTIESEGTLWVEGGAPRYDGSVTLSRLAGAVLQSGKAVTGQPWRATSRVRATSAAALFEDVEFQYGPDDRALRLSGTADLALVARPKFAAVLSARQIDLDRTLSNDSIQRPPAAVFKMLTDALSQSVRPPIPIKIGLGIDNLMMGGAPITAVRGDVITEDGNWSIDSLEFRAPGASQVRISGRLQLAGQPQFSGPASLDSADPKALIGWLEGQREPVRGQMGPLKARGDLALGADRIAIERLKADVDRKAIEGRLAYSYAANGKSATLDAALSAPEFDLDSATAMVQDALAGSAFDRPGEIALAVDIGKAVYAGIEAKTVKAKLTYDASGLNIERLSIADFGGAVLDSSGRIDTSSALPRGSLALTLDARKLDGVQALLARFAPQVAQALAKVVPAATATRLNAKLDVEPVIAAGKSMAKLKLDGAVGGIRVDISADGSGTFDRLEAADIRLDGRLDTADGAALAAAVGLDRVARLKKGPARLSLAAHGPAAGDVAIDARFAGDGLDASAVGTVRRAGADWNAALALAVNAADSRLPHRDAAIPVPASLAARLTVAGNRFTFDDLSGSVAGSAVKGRLAVERGLPVRVEGAIDAETVDAAALVGAVLGASASTPRTGWSSEPFGPSALADVVGKLELSSDRLILAPGVVARQVRSAVRFAPRAIMLDTIEGRLADGSLTAHAVFRSSDTGVTADAGVALANADLAALLPRGAQTTGRVSLQLDAKGTGLSPAALVGALDGKGNVTVTQLQVLGMDPNAIDAALRAAERGVQTDAARIGDIVRVALDAGRLNVPEAATGLAVSGGRVSLAEVTAAAQNADILASGRWGIAEDALDLKLTLIGPPKPNAPGGQRPQIAVVLKGPIATARRDIDASALANWLTLRAVDLEARKVEAAEQEAKRRVAEAERRAAEEAKRVQAAEEVKRLQDEVNRRQAAEAARRAAEERRARDSVSATATAPALPPPVTIAPPPGGTVADRQPRSAPANPQ